jgi:hypothetical protein
VALQDQADRSRHGHCGEDQEDRDLRRDHRIARGVPSVVSMDPNLMVASSLSPDS